MVLGADGVLSNFVGKLLRRLNSLGNWLLLVMLALILWVLVINPWVVRMRLEKIARSIPESEIRQSLEKSNARLLADKTLWFPVVHMKYERPYQSGLVHFDDGNYVRFAFISGHNNPWDESVACFVGDHYKRVTKWKGWCCELILDRVKDLDSLDRQLAELERSE